MTDRDKKYTPEQEAAIYHRGGSLLVSSGAGSGKTMVLVERLLSYIDEGFDIDNFLIITYTRAAALELRERIYDRLQHRLSDTPGNNHLRRQTILSRGANIDTIHTFCSVLLRENAHLTGIAPDFRVADENESRIIREEVLNDVFDRTYEKVDDSNKLKEVLEHLVEGRDDGRLMQIVSDIYIKLQSIPDIDSWINAYIKKEKRQCKAKDISKTDWGRYLLDIISGRVEYYYKKMLELKEVMISEEKFNECYGASINETIESIRALISALNNSWDDAVKASDIPFNRVKRVSGYDELKAIRTWCRDELKKITKILNTSSDEHIKDIDLLHKSTTFLLELVRNFDKAYEDEKRMRNIVDFSDLEHITLSLLYDKDSGRKSDIAVSISNRFEEIMVDEYQDVNEVQEKIFAAITKDENNIFMVGDVKQSIYRFRLADPTIFLGKYRVFREYESVIPEYKNIKLNERQPLQHQSMALPPAKINLSMNFRSGEEILHAVNHIFKNIMSYSFGEMDYTDAESLIPGQKLIQGKQGITGIQGYNAPVEIDLLSVKETINTSDSEEESLSALEIEAKHVAGRIKELLNGSFMIKDESGNHRKLLCSDIAILSRSIQGVSWRYAKALSDIGIESDISNSENYFSEPEVQAVISLLTVIDNPLEDISLAAVLSGPVYNFTSDEMVEIRAEDSGNSYYEALKQTQEHNKGSSAIHCKCKKVIDDITELRELVSDMPSDRFIWNLYDKTEILKRVSAMQDGERRRNNLLALAECAYNYEQSGYKGLYDFLTFLNGLRERGIDITETYGTGNGSTGSTDKVKILSIHKSKGLEFPVVFLVNLAKKHNRADLNKPVIFHKTFGIGSMLTNPVKRIRYTTLARMAITEKLKQEMYSEELRILYVAMTRAKEKLIMCASYGDIDKIFTAQSIMADKNGRFSPYALMTMNSIGEWLLAGCAGIPKEYALINKVDMSISEDASGAELRKVPAYDVHTDDDILTVKKIPDNTDDKSNEDNYSEIIKKFEFVYPYSASIMLPSKLTVTGLKRLNDPESESAQWTREEYQQDDINLKTPKFDANYANMTATQRGTLLHNIMSYIDYNKCSAESDICEELNKYRKLGLFSKDEIKTVTDDLGKIVTLFKTELGKRLKKAFNESALKREFKFSLLTPAKQYFPDGGNDKILLQGIIDCFFEENGSLVIVDFKTDRVTVSNVYDKANKYAPQLSGYSEALKRITGKEIKDSIVYFFETGTAVTL